MPPTKFSDLVRIVGFARGTNVWTKNAEELIKKGYDFTKINAHSEDIMLNLLKYGMDKNTAFQIAEMAREGKIGKRLNEEQEAVLRIHNIPEWYIEFMKKIRYLFPKSYAVEYIINYLRMIWYKIHYPAAFYAAVLTVDATDFDCNILAEGKKRVELELKRTITAKDGQKIKKTSWSLQWNVMKKGYRSFREILIFLILIVFYRKRIKYVCHSTALKKLTEMESMLFLKKEIYCFLVRFKTL